MNATELEGIAEYYRELRDNGEKDPLRIIMDETGYKAELIEGSLEAVPELDCLDEFK